jgi:beta-glucosidase
VDQRVEDWMAALTLDEKVALTVGQDFWHTTPVPRLGIPSITMHDGPHGLRIPVGGEAIGLHHSVPATAFPTLSAMGASWNPELMEEIGHALGRECQAANVQILLGPGFNIKRTPLCGRNFEYFSEDPVLAAEMAKGWVRGIQAEGVGASVKHYACNNQEWERMAIDAEIDERTLRELYLKAFERVVTSTNPWTVMAAYNRVNGQYATENQHLLRDILKGEWGYQGVVVSDWGAVNDKPAAIRGGTDLEMPGPTPQADLKAAVDSGQVPMELLDDAVRRVLSLVVKGLDSHREGVQVDFEQHHTLALRAAEESLVLLKNDRAALPIRPGAVQRVAVIGWQAEHLHFEAGGSSHVTPTQVETFLPSLARELGEQVAVHYAPGWDKDGATRPEWQAAAVAAATAADVCIIMGGLPENAESEGFDRRHLDLPEGQTDVIQAVAAAQPRTVVVLANGAPVSMPWIETVPAVLLAGLAGQAVAAAVAGVLSGRVNPSGKLAETYPVRLEDTPAYLNYPGQHHTVRYGEGVFVGYRYYDKKQITPLFPFGHGLSYSNFVYRSLTVSRRELTDRDDLILTVALENQGTVSGREVVQVYAHPVAPSPFRPERELVAFKKVDVPAGETVTVQITVSGCEFAWYDTSAQEWIVDGGPYELLVGGSSRALPLQVRVLVEPAVLPRREFNTSNVVRDFLKFPVARRALQEMLPDWVEWDAENLSPEGPMAMLLDLPIRQMVRFARGHVTEHMVDRFVAMMNHHVGQSPEAHD